MVLIPKFIKKLIKKYTPEEVPVAVVQTKLSELTDFHIIQALRLNNCIIDFNLMQSIEEITKKTKAGKETKYFINESLFLTRFINDYLDLSFKYSRIAK